MSKIPKIWNIQKTKLKLKDSKHEFDKTLTFWDASSGFYQKGNKPILKPIFFA